MQRISEAGGGAGLLPQLTVAVKIQTNEIQMKFCRGRDGEIVRPG